MTKEKTQDADVATDSAPVPCSASSPRPWGDLINGDSPWDEYTAFENWIKTKIHPETVEYFEDAPSGFSSYLYAALAEEFDKANDLGSASEN